MTPTLVTSCTALPPEGAGAPWGGPAERRMKLLAVSPKLVELVQEGIVAESPEERGAGDDFDEAVHAETDESDAGGGDARDQRAGGLGTGQENCGVL